MKNLPIHLLSYIPLFLCLSAKADEIEVSQFELESGVSISVQYHDSGVGGVRYTLVQSPDLQNWNPVPNSDVLNLGSGLFDASGDQDDSFDRLFYRVDAERVPATLGFEMGELVVGEGSGDQELVVRFVDQNGDALIYNGPVRYEWEGATYLVSDLTGEVMANGSQVSIPMVVEDNAGTEQLRQVRLNLIVDGETAYSVDPAASTSTITIEENDNYWRGSFETGAESIDLEIYVRKDNGTLLVFMTEGTAFLKTGFKLAPAPILTETQFSADFPDVEIDSTPENLLTAGTVVKLTLTADEVNGDTVDKRELAGTGTLTISNPAKPHLTTAIPGTFLLLEDPPLQPRDDIELE